METTANAQATGFRPPAQGARIRERNGHGPRPPAPLEILSLPCHPISRSAAGEFAIEAINAGTPRSVLFVNALKIVNARTDDSLRVALERADLVGADGQPVVWVSRMLGQPVPGRLNGTDYMMDLLRLADEHRWRVFFLGATDAVLDDLVDVCAADYPGMVLAGRHHGYFDEADDAQVAARVRRASPDLLFVGMPSPRKELWLVDHGPPTGAGISVAVGGSFDVLAGHVPRAPERWQVRGLEWLWRLRQEPRRLWRRVLTTNLRFLAVVAREWLRTRVAKKP